MYDQQNLEQSANGVLLLVAVADASMLEAAAGESKEIIIMRNYHAFLRESVRNVIFVGSPK